MFAYIKILNGAHKDEKKVIPVTNLCHFNVNKHNKNVKYVIKSKSNNKDSNETCIILLLADTQKQLQEQINATNNCNKSRRIVNVPTKLLHTATSSSSDEKESKKTKKPSSRTDNPNRTLQNENLEDFVDNKINEFRCKTDTSTISHTRSPAVMTDDHTNIGKSSTKENSNLTSNETNTKLVATNSTLRLSALSSTNKLKCTANTHESNIKTKVISKSPVSIDPTNIDKVAPKNAIINPDDVDKHIIKENSKLCNDIGTEDNNTKQKGQLRKRCNSSPLCTPTLPAKKLKFTTENTPENDKFKVPSTSTVFADRTNSMDNNLTKESVNGSSTLVPSNSTKKLTSPAKNVVIEKPKVIKYENMHPASKCRNTIQKMENELEVLKEKCSRLSKELQIIRDENEDLKKSKESYKKKYTEKDAEWKSLDKLHKEFQLTIIEKMKERDEVFQRLIEAQKTVLPGCNFPSIGALRTSDNMKRYHIGHDIWLSENEYTGLLNASKTPSQLAGNITTLVFTMDELLTSTKTGFKSRRSGQGKVACNKLDSVKLAACEAFYKYWMENIYTPVTKLDIKNYDRDQQRFHYYSGKKIADFKKPATPNNTKKGNGRKIRLPPKRDKHEKKDEDANEDENESEKDESGSEKDENGRNKHESQNEKDDNKKDKYDNEYNEGKEQDEQEKNYESDEKEQEEQELWQNYDENNQSEDDPLFIDPEKMDQQMEKTDLSYEEKDCDDSYIASRTPSPKLNNDDIDKVSNTSSDKHNVSDTESTRSYDD